MSQMPGTCECGTIRDKADFADGVKLRVLRWETLLDCPSRPDVFIHKDPHQKDARCQKRGCDDSSRGQGDVGPRSRDFQQPQKLERQETFSPGVPRRKTGCWYLDFSPLRPILDF